METKRNDGPRTPMKQLSTSTLDPAASTMRRLEQTVHVSDTVRGNAKFRETMSYIMATTENPDSPLPMYTQDIVDLSSGGESGSEDFNESDVSFESDEDEDRPGSKKNSLTRPVPVPASTSAAASATTSATASATPATPATPPNPSKGITAGVSGMNLGSSPTTPRLSVSSLVENLDDSPSMRYSQKASLFQGGEQSPLQRTSTHPPNRPQNRQHHLHHHCKLEETETPISEEDLGLESPMIADDGVTRRTVQIPSLIYAHSYVATSPTPKTRTSRDSSELVSAATIQRILATQRYFVDQRQNFITYLVRRKERLDAIKTFLEQHELPDVQRETLWQKFCEKESSNLRKRRTKIKESNFRIIAKIGRGAFGHVYLAVKSDTNEVCAIKKMSKTHLFEMQKADNVMVERDILSMADSEWLVKLLYSFQDQKHLYLAMEYVPGGDLRSLLRMIGSLDTEHAAFYTAQMIQSISTLHGMGFFHRDIKPENFLIDKDGHIKLTDFGLSKNGLIRTFIERWSAKALHLNQRAENKTAGELLELHRARQKKMSEDKLNRNRSYSIVGSPDYMAPELLLGRGCDYMVDYWAIGCILFEMLVGYPPFAASTVEEIFHGITNFDGNLSPPIFSEDDENQAPIPAEAWDLITKLVCIKENRLGKGKKGLQELKDHPFFTTHNIDWNNLRNSKEPPFLPRLDSTLDTAYFAQQDHIHESDEPPSPMEIQASPGKLRRVENNFVGFTFEHKGHLEEMFADLEESGLLSPELLETLKEMKKNHKTNQQAKATKDLRE